MVKIDAIVEPLSVAKTHQGNAEAEQPGAYHPRQAGIDDDCNQTGQMPGGE